MVAKEIWKFASERGFAISGLWIASKENVKTDEESRKAETSADWKLLPKVFQLITRTWGPMTVDAFASLSMHQLPRYWSWRADPLSLGIDGMLQSWEGEVPYIFPPFCLLPRILNKLKSQEVEKAVIVCPLWPGQSWYPLLLNMAIAKPLALPRLTGLLKNHRGEEHPLELLGHLKLTAWLVSGIDSKARDFQRSLPPLSPIAESLALQGITKAPGHNGFAGVGRKALIPLDLQLLR